MLRPDRNGIIHRAVLGIALLLVLVIVLVGVWRFATSTPGIPDATLAAGTEQGALNKTLLDAIRDGDITQVQHLLQQGANANARDEAGDTALMRAALYADVEMMRVLVESS